jgi:hypothetical protein
MAKIKFSVDGYDLQFVATNDKKTMVVKGWKSYDDCDITHVNGKEIPRSKLAKKKAWDTLARWLEAVGYHPDRQPIVTGNFTIKNFTKKDILKK